MGLRDEYDERHIADFNQHVKVYSNSDIESIMLEYVEKDLIGVPEVDQWDISLDSKRRRSSYNFKETVNNLQNGLKILDTRIVTAITGRISSYQSYLDEDIELRKRGTQKWNLVTVYRCNNFQNY